MHQRQSDYSIVGVVCSLFPRERCSHQDHLSRLRPSRHLSSSLSLTMPAVSPSGPTLATLPSELRKLVVSYLVPDPNNFRAGCKEDLRHANLVRSCLHEWVPEYMFKDMALKHVHLYAPPQLQRVAEDPRNAGLLNFAKYIQVQLRSFYKPLTLD